MLFSLYSQITPTTERFYALRVLRAGFDSGSRSSFSREIACAPWLNCHAYEVRKIPGIPDCFARVGVREDSLWLRSRVRPEFDDPWIEEIDMGRTLWTLQELCKRARVGRPFAVRHLRAPVGTLKNAHRNCYLWREIHWVQLAKDIGSRKIHVPLRSLRARKLNAYEAPAQHFLADDQSAENQRIAKHRADPAFWSRMI
jgi:hypothetical protein